LLAYDFSILNEHFYYDVTSPSFLKYKKSVYRYSRILYNEGDNAGFKSNKGYWKVTLNGVSYSVHRVIMVLFGNDISNYEVDHIDRNRSNNNIANLRLVTRIVNMKNKSLYSNNSTGFMGIHPKHRNGVEVSIVATWRENGEHRAKEFSINKYGYTGAVELARKHRETMLAKLEDSEDYSIQHWNKEQND